MRALRYILRLFLVLLLLALLTLGAGYAYLRSESGMTRIAHEVSARASSEDARIVLSGLRGDLFGSFALAQLQIADREGVWLEANNIRIAWKPIALLRHQPPLTVLEADTIAVLRAPAPTTSEEPAATDTAQGSLRDYAIYLPRMLRVQELRIAEPVVGFEQRVAFHGTGDARRYTLSLSTLAGVPLSLNGTLQPQKEDFVAALSFHEAEGGIVAALLGLPNTIALALDANITANTQGNLSIHAARLRAGTLTADARGSYALSENRIDLSLLANAPDMHVLQALLGQPMSGNGRLQLSAKGTFDQLAVALEANMPHLVIGDDRLERFAVKVDGTLNPAAWGSDAFKAQGTMGAQGLHNGHALTLALQGNGGGKIIDLTDMRASYGANTLGGTLQAKGSFEQFTLASDTTITTADGGAQLVLDGVVDSVKLRYAGKAKGTLHHQANRFAFDTTLDANTDEIAISALSLKGPGADIEGKATIAMATQLADAALTIRASDLAPLGQAIGQPLGGSLVADVSLKRTGGKQQAMVDATARHLFVPGLRIADAKLAAKASDAKALEGLDITLAATALHTDAVQVDTLRGTAKGGLKPGLDVTLAAGGSMQKKPWNVALAAKAHQPAQRHYRLDLATLTGAYDHAPIQLSGPTTLLHQPTTSSLTPLTLQLAGGHVRAEGKITGNAVSGKLAISSLALQQLPGLGLPEAVLDATLDLGGSVAAPVLRWQAKSAATLDGMDIAAHTTGSWKNGALQSDLALQSDKANAKAHVSLPARLALQPFATDLSERTALQGTLDASLPLTMLNAKLRPAGHRLGGLIAGKATLAGTLGSPYFEGAFTLADGRYDHSTTGVCLRDITARLTGTKQAIRLEEFSATDSAKKRFTARADFSLTGTPTLSGDARFDHFKLFCGGMMNGNIDGALAANGTPSAMSVAGKLELGPLNVQIPGARVSSTIPEVPIQWIKPGEQQAEAMPNNIALDITLVAPQQLFIRGRGLDAEFAGELAITGTATTPKLDGHFDKRRGTFILLDRVLALDTASIRFEGPMPPSPFLSVEASTKVNSHTIGLSLKGNAAKPELALTSTPSLPQDEVLALLLFGRQLERISAFEALQLAQATRTLAGLDGGGPGIVGTIRDTLGLDRLEVGADADSNVSVSTGKYITDDVYVGVVQGAKPEEREIVTEITLTPSILGKTAVDSIGNQSLGVEWKRDY